MPSSKYIQNVTDSLVEVIEEAIDQHRARDVDQFVLSFCPHNVCLDIFFITQMQAAKEDKCWENLYELQSHSRTHKSLTLSMPGIWSCVVWIYMGLCPSSGWNAMWLVQQRKSWLWT